MTISTPPCGGGESIKSQCWTVYVSSVVTFFSSGRTVKPRRVGIYKKHDIAIKWGNNCTECNDAFVESFE